MANHDDDYFAGLLDAQLSVSLTKSQPAQLRVQLVCDDERVLPVLRERTLPARETIVRRPGKRDSCVALVQGDEATKLLEFAASKCVLKKPAAGAALAFARGEATAEDTAHALRVAQQQQGVQQHDVPVGWVSGFFDVRGAVQVDGEGGDKENEAPADKKRTRRRHSVKLVLPKSEKHVIPLIQRALQAGKVRRSSPCRIVFESAEVSKFLQSAGTLVRVKRPDLSALPAAV